MERTVFGYHKKVYLIQLHYWAKRLEATEMTVHKDGSVDLFAGNDCICLNYSPSGRELVQREDRGLSYDPRFDCGYEEQSEGRLS